MRARWLMPSIVSAGLLLAATAGGWALVAPEAPGPEMTSAAEKFLATLSDEQKEKCLMEYGEPERVGWHFIPKDFRKGLQIREMSKPQRAAALALLEASLSEVGYKKANQIRELEIVLRELEKERSGGNIRDPERYYWTIFGKPAAEGRWGLSIEGHHLSLNFVVEDNTVIASTPAFFAANPAVVMSEVPGGAKKGTRVLAREEQLAFDLLASLNAEQLQSAILAEKSPDEIRAAGEPQPPQTAAEGVAAAQLEKTQQKTLRELLAVYAKNMPAEIAEQRMSAIDEAGFDKVHFAWAGAKEPGIGHYYRVQGPTFLIEFVNTQPDPAGNPANHIHCVWRDPRGDFAMPIKDAE